MSLLRQGKAQVLSIYIGESDQWNGNTLYVEIVEFLRKNGCAGATVTRAIAGYGAGVRLHEQKAWQLTSDAPVMIQVIDQPARLQRLLPHLFTMVGSGIMTLHETEVLKYTHAYAHGLPVKLPVRQVMETSVLTVLPTAPLTQVVSLLLDAPFRVLPVVNEQRHLVGIISTGDLIRHDVLPIRRGIVRRARELDEATAQHIDTSLEHIQQSALLARDVMNTIVRTVEPANSIRDAAQIMLTAGLRRLPVVEKDGTLVGMLSRADLLQVVVTSPLLSPQARTTTQTLTPSDLSTDRTQATTVAAYLQTAVSTVDGETPLTEVIDALVISPLKRVIVVDTERHVLGIISDVDVLTRIQAEMRPNILNMLADWARGRRTRIATGTLPRSTAKAQRAIDVMNTQVVTVTMNTTIDAAIETMMRMGRTFLPVVDEEQRLEGVVGRSDLLKLFIER